MIGYQILAIEQDDGNYLCDKVDAYFGIGIRMLIKEAEEKNAPEEISKESLRLYNSFGKTDKQREFILTKDELKEISNATTCIEGRSGYHKLACDGIYIIPITKDRFLHGKKFFNT